jgi:hypothetical protein
MFGLEIGLRIGSKSRYTPATLGRCGDIIVERSAISRSQCLFEFHEKTKQVMLQDRSSNNATQFFGETAMPFELGRPHRRVVVDKKVNPALGLGSVACGFHRFRIVLVWHERDELPAEMYLDHREDNPH